MPVADRVRELRNLLGITQEALADRSGLRRTEIVRIEGGSNKGRSHNIRVSLARGFGLSPSDCDALLDGTLSASSAFAKLSSPPPPPAPERTTDQSLAHFRERVWWAYHALPRGESSKPPTFVQLHDAHGKERMKLFRDVLSGAKRTLGARDAAELGAMFGVGAEWLLEGKGPAPKLTGELRPIPPDRHVQHDPAHLVKLATTATGEIDPLQLLHANNFLRAIAYWGDVLTDSAVRAVMQAHDVVNAPNAKTVEEWKQILFRDVREEAKRKAPKKKHARRDPPAEPKPAARRSSG